MSLWDSEDTKSCIIDEMLLRLIMMESLIGRPGHKRRTMITSHYNGIYGLGTIKKNYLT